MYDNQMEKFVEKMESIQRRLFAKKFYEDGNIEEFIQELKEIKIESISNNCKDEEWIGFIGKQTGRLGIIALLLRAKKLEKQKEDLKPLGRYIQELGKEIEEYGI